MGLINSVTGSANNTAAPTKLTIDDITNAYRNVYGRDPDDEGLKYWDNVIKSGKSAQEVYSQFLNDGKNLGANGRYDLSLNDAIKPYDGYQSTDSGTVADEWVRNVIGRDVTEEDKRQSWYAAANKSPTLGEFNDAYHQFLSYAKSTGGDSVNTNLGVFEASRLNPLATKKRDQPAQTNQFVPDINRAVQPDQTIEGRINNLLRTDQFGNYINPVVRQASERALQAFAGRGLLNSSMAAQAAQEAAISKAIEITGPDAQRFFEQSRANQDWNNKFAQDEINFGYEMQKLAAVNDLDIEKIKAEYGLRRDNDAFTHAFNLRQNYITSIGNITNNYQQMVNNINNSAMSPDDKQAALEDAAATRDGEVAYINELYSKMPGWHMEWLSAAVPLQGVDVSKITDVRVLRNIIADPAQPQSVREAARARLNALQSSNGSAGGGGGSTVGGSGTGDNGVPIFDGGA